MITLLKRYYSFFVNLCIEIIKFFEFREGEDLETNEANELSYPHSFTMINARSALDFI